MRYKNLVFDLYGTLVDIHTDEERPAVWEKMAMLYGGDGAHYAPMELKQSLYAAVEQTNAAAGQGYECYPDLPIEPVFAGLYAQKGVADAAPKGEVAARLFRVLVTDYLRLYPGVLRALAALRADGHRLWLLSNAQAAFTRRELNLLGLPGCFDGILLSSDYACRKPDRRFFDALLQGQRLDPASCLMIGNDLGTDIAGAKNAGLAALYLHTNLSPADAAPQPGLAPDYRLDTQDWNEILPRLREICAAPAGK